MDEEQKIVINADSIKNFIKKHKVAIAIVGTSIVWWHINRVALAQHDEFLKENGLYDLFYGFDDLVEF